MFGNRENGEQNKRGIKKEKEKKFSNLLMLTGERKHKAEINSKVPDKKVDGKN